MTAPGGYTLGIKEVLEQVAKVDGKLDSLAAQVAQLGQSTAVELAEMRMRMTAIEQREERAQDRRWQLVVSLIGSTIAILIAVAGFVIH